ncbi:MAG: hypothetical protein ABR581_06360 [Thermoleophilaceae bacterium]
MTRRLNIALRSSLLIAAGTALIAVPAFADLSVAALLSGVCAGALAVALGLAGTADTGRGTLPASTQGFYDRALGGGLLILAVAFGLSGQRGALLLFGAVGLATLAVATMTRYVISPAHST